MRNPVGISMKKDEIMIRISEGATQKETVECLNKKIPALKKLYKSEKTPICVVGKVLKNKEIEEIRKIINKDIDVEVTFDSPKVLGLHGIKRVFEKEIENSETKFYKGNMRSGQKIEFEGSLVILGDVNGGAEVIAGENIVVLGHLRGLAHAGANGNIVAGYQEGYSEFSKQSKWLDNFLSFVPQWFTLFGVEVGSGMLIYSCEGIIELLKIICSLVVLIVPIIMTIMYNKFETIAYKLMILTHSFMTALILLGWVFGSLNTACWRLSPIVGTSVILCIMFAKWIYDKKQYHRMFAIIVIPIEILMIISTIGILKINNTRSESNQALENVIDTLEKNNLQYGYGTFWNANSITLLSDNDVKVRCINVNESGVSPRAYQTNINWYKDNSYKEYFLLLKADEYYTYKYSENYVEPIKEIKSDNYFILVYNYNLLENK